MADKVDWSEERLKALEQDFNRLEEKVLVHTDNGISKFQTTSVYLTRVKDHLCKAEGELEKSSGKRSLSDAGKDLREATIAFQEALDHTSFWYKWMYVHAYIHQILFIVLAAFIVWLLSCKEIAESTLGFVPMWSLLFGAIGAVFYGMYWLWVEVGLGRIRRVWNIMVFASPFYGAVAGLVAYLLFKVGILAVGGGKTQDNWGPMLLSLLSGYKWGWLHGVLTGLGRTTKTSSN